MSILANIRAAGEALLGRPTKKPQSGVAYGNMWPVWEQQAPQYPVPNPYNLAQAGYRKDELVYACIQYRAVTVSEPPAMLVTGTGKDTEPVSGLFDAFPGHRPNTEMSEVEFWQVAEMYRNIAGTSVWEIETNRLGQPINLWPLNPSYCSFMRGSARPMDRVRYQYPGLQPVDIPREKLILFQNFDPIYPLLKGLSPTAVALRAIGVHSSTSDFLNIFFQRGAVIQGYLKFEQSLNEMEADRAKASWRAAHGGSSNWGENNIGVLGQGADYVPIQMNMRDMAFAEVDGRTESQICQVFGISPILMGAKVGLNSSTYSNYEQAMKNFTTIVLKPSWRWYSGEITQQLVPLLTDDTEVRCEFDTNEIASLKEDEDAVWTRALNAAKNNILTRDEVRSLLGYDAIDGDNKIFVGITLKGPSAPDESARIADPDLEDSEIEELNKPEPNPFGATTTGAPPQFGKPTVTEPDEEQVKAWFKLALTTTGTVGAPFDDELMACTSKSQRRAVFETHWPKRARLDPVLELKRFNDYVETRK